MMLRRNNGTHVARPVMCGLALLLLVSCGGGGGGGGDSEPPPPAPLQVNSSSVPDGSIGVVLDPVIDLRLNHIISGGGATADHVRLLDFEGAAVPIEVRFYDARVEVTVLDSLRARTEYSLTLFAGVRADNGMVLGEDFVVSFKTQSAVFEEHQLLPYIERFGVRQPTLVAMGDLDGDSHSDLAVLGNLITLPNPDAEGFTLLIYRQVTPDSVQLVQQIDHLTGGSVRTGRLVALDTDWDGQLEIVAPVCGRGLQIFRRGADGLFEAQPLITTSYACPLFITDIDGDGHQDLAGAGQEFTGTSDPDQGFQVWLSTSSGLLAKPPIGLNRSDAVDLAFGDLDRDGKADLFAVFPFTSQPGTPARMFVYSQGDAGEFSRNPVLSEAVSGLCKLQSGYCREPLFIDINGDDLLDLLFGSTGVISYLRQPDGSFASGWTIDEPIDSLHAADLDNDGLDDLLIVGHGIFGSGYHVAAGMTQRNDEIEFSSTYHLPVDHKDPGAVAVADFDGDGFSDLVAADDWHGVVLMRQVGR